MEGHVELHQLAAEASTDPQGHSGAGGLVSDVRNWGCAFVPSCQLVVECWLPPDGGGGVSLGQVAPLVEGDSWTGLS